MKRLITLSLAALMVLSLSAVAFAIDNNTTKIVGATPTADHSTESVKSLGSFMLVSMQDIDAKDDDVLVYPGYDADGYVYVQPGMTAHYPLYANKAAYDVLAEKPNPYSSHVKSTGSPTNCVLDGTGTDDCADCKNTYPAQVTVSDAVKSLKISTKYKSGNDVVESMRIVYKKALHTGEYGYYLAIKTKDMTGTGYKDFGAEITLKKTSGNDGDKTAPKSYQFEMTYDVRFRVRLDKTNYNVFKNAFQVNDNKADPYSEETFEFPETNGVYYEVSMFAVPRTIVAMNLDIDQAIIDLYPAANLDFFNGNGASFNRDGILTIPAESGTFIYGRDAEGRLVEVAAEYDDGEESFKVTTKTLGQYVVSDVELDLTIIPVAEPEGEPTPETPVEPEVKPNVPTGAVA